MQAPSQDPSWRQGYQAALRDLAELAEHLQLDGAGDSDYRSASMAAAVIERALRTLRRRLEAAHTTLEDAPLPPEAAREWTEG